MARQTCSHADVHRLSMPNYQSCIMHHPVEKKKHILEDLEKRMLHNLWDFRTTGYIRVDDCLES